MESQLTILFENPFWVGIYERIDGDCYQVCKITFGAEPSDREVYEFLLRNWAVLRFSQSTRTGKVKEKSKNPKRRQREIRSQLQKTGVGTKAQQALNQQREENQIQRRVKSRQRQESEQRRRYALRQEKKRAKHKGH